MENNFVLVEYLSNINSIIKQTFGSMQRIKLICFDASCNYLVFGATSGGIYIFKRDPCEFIKLIPSKEGSANLIAISPDEHHIGIASSKGLILILENFIEDSSAQYQVYNEHEGRNITCIKWQKNDLYIGDDSGKVSVVSTVTALFQAKSIFQLPTVVLMTLDSSIVQLDVYQSYLLISTKTKSYLCNTEKENFIQVGKKLRDGHFGCCFLKVSDTEDNIVIQNSRSEFKTLKENTTVLADNNTNNRIFCARPGGRLWEVGFDAKVLCTYQYKGTLNENLTNYLIIGCDEECVLQKRLYSPCEKGPEKINFRTLYPVCDKFILTYDSEGLYIFNPTTNKLLFWTVFADGIKHVSFTNNSFYIWINNLEIKVLSVVELESLILALLYKKQYYLCTDICIEFTPIVLELLEESKKLYFLNVLKTKITCDDLLKKLQPILDKVLETNEKLFTRQQKSKDIVLVENLYVNQKPLIAENTDENTDLKLILKQFKLNKTHSSIDIPEVVKLFESLDGNNLFKIIKDFESYVKTEIKENCIDWCLHQYLKHISKQNVMVNDLENEAFDFLTEAVIRENESLKFSCTCGYPLPKCHKNPPAFYKTALDIFKTGRNAEEVLKYIPYLWKYKVKSEVHGLNLTALIQFSHMKLFKEHTIQLTYDSWHDVLGYFSKINKGICLNCDQPIDLDSLFTWTELAKVIVQSLGAKNAIKILEKYDKVIPNGALDPTFYQTCIFAHSFINDNITTKMKPEEPIIFMENLKGTFYEQFQETLAKYFRKKYADTKSQCCDFSAVNTGVCLLCNLPLNNNILFEYELVKTCGHKFHKFCFDRNNKTCHICD